MAYNTQNYWVFEHQPSSDILENTKHDVSDKICFCPQVRGGGETPTQLGPLERANLNPITGQALSDSHSYLITRGSDKVFQWMRLALSNGPN
jgi:hypothetical protein